jgi:hypothetical protein
VRGGDRILHTTEYTEWQRPRSGVHSIMKEKVAQAGEGGVRGCTPTPFQPITMKYKVAVYLPGQIHLPYFISTHIYSMLHLLHGFTFDFFLLVNSLTGRLANGQLKKLKEPTMIKYLWIPKHMHVLVSI